MHAHTQRLKWSALYVEPCKSIPVLFSAGILFVNYAWLVCTKILTNSVLCAKSHGVCFLQSAMTTGIKMRVNHDYSIASLHNLLWILEPTLRVLMVNKLVSWECNILKRTKKLSKNFWKQRGVLVWNQKLLWEKKAYLVTANTHSFFFTPTKHLSHSLCLF